MLALGYSNSFALTYTKNVFSWGNNNEGQLGLGHNRNQYKPQLVEFFEGKQVRKIICGGGYHTMAITESGDVFSWGNNNCGQLGLGHYNHQNIPQLVKFFVGKQVRKIFCGKSHTMAITESGDIFSWGYNNDGQLGLGHYNHQNKPQLVEFFEGKRVRKIICGGFHTIAITESGDVFSWGHNYFGELGLGHNDNQNKPQLVDFFVGKQVRKIICGIYHTMAITELGDVFSWGFNNENIPQLVDFFENKQVRKIFCREHHTIAITKMGDVFAWGNNYGGELGLGHNDNQTKPQLIEFFEGKQIRKIFCGDFHTITITESGNVFSWGNNNDGQLGLGHNQNQNKPQLVEFFEKHKIMPEKITRIKSARSIIY